MAGKTKLYCSFCGKAQHEVRRLIAGPSTFICDECIDLTYAMIHDIKPEGGSLAIDLAERRRARLKQVLNVSAERPLNESS